MKKKVSVKKTAGVFLAALCLAICLCFVTGTGAQAASKTTLEKKTEKIVKLQVKKGSSKQAALKALFKYTERKFGYARTVGFKAASGWGKTYALEMFQKKKGSCYHFAAAYAYLAKEATGLPVRLCIGQTNGFNASRWQQHAWVEIKISGKWYIYDPNMDKFAADSSLKYYKKSRDKLYGVTYKVSKRYTVKY